MSDEFNCRTVFLITIDALNLKHLKVYGYERNTAPNLEKFIQFQILLEHLLVFYNTL